MNSGDPNAHGAPPLPSGAAVVAVVGAAIISEDRCLVAKRRPGGSAGGKWEFPGGKVERGESPADALEREIHEELGGTIRVLSWIGRGVAEPDQRVIVLDVYRCALNGPKIETPGPAHDAILWATMADLRELDWAEADVPIAPQVERLLSTWLRKASKGGPHE